MNMKKMYKHKKLITGVATRLVVGVLLLAVLGVALTGCGNRSSTNLTTVTFTWPAETETSTGTETDAAESDTAADTAADTDTATESADAAESDSTAETDTTAETDAETGAETGAETDAVAGTTGGMSDDQIKKLGEKIANSGYAVAICEQLIAAQRGYDISGKPDSKTTNNYIKYQDTETNPLPAPDTSKSVEYAKKVLKAYNTGDNTDKNDFSLYADQIDARALGILVSGLNIDVQLGTELGMIDQILRWIGIGFEWLIDVPGFDSFILGTLYFAIALEILMLPLAIYQQKNSRKQAKLRPREMAIRNKYKGRNDQATQQKVTQEIQDLYAKEGYSPMSGCLPLLVTMPFLILLYYIVQEPMVYMMGADGELVNAFRTYASAHPAAGGLGMELSTPGSIQLLSAIREGGMELVEGMKDFALFSVEDRTLCYNELQTVLGAAGENIPNFSLFGLNLGLIPTAFLSDFKANWWLLFIPVLTFLVYWGGSKISRKFTFQPITQDAGNDPAKGCSNGMMNVMMPAMSAFFTFMVPAAIGVYWMFKSILGTVKQIVIAKVMPLPTFTEEDYEAAKRELAGKDKNKPPKRSGTRNPNVRSLHYIDEEDFEETSSNQKKQPKADYVEPEEAKEEKPQTADNAYSEGVTIKEDRPARDANEAKSEKKKWKFFGKKKDE